MEWLLKEDGYHILKYNKRVEFSIPITRLFSKYLSYPSVLSIYSNYIELLFLTLNTELALYLLHLRTPSLQMDIWLDIQPRTRNMDEAQYVISTFSHPSIHSIL
jgi:hypothetical protein